MIQEIRNLGKNLIAAITPASLIVRDLHPMDVNGNYDWNAQAYNYEVCNFGTCYSTKYRTGDGGDSSPDSNPD